METFIGSRVWKNKVKKKKGRRLAALVMATKGRAAVAAVRSGICGLGVNVNVNGGVGVNGFKNSDGQPASLRS